MNNPRRAVFQGVLVAVVLAVAAGVWWWQQPPAMTPEERLALGKEQSLDEELVKNRLYRLWKEKYPDDYQVFLKETAVVPVGGEGERSTGDTLAPQSSKHLFRYVAYADDETVMRLTNFLTRQYEALQAISPLQCSLYAMGDKEFDTRLLKVIGTKDEGLADPALMDLLAKVIETSDRSRSIAAVADLDKTQAKILSSDNPEEREKIKAAENTQGYVCQASISTLKIVQTLPKDEAARFMRSIFHTLFSGAK